MARERRTPDRIPVPTDWQGTESQEALPPILNLLGERANEHDQELVDQADAIERTSTVVEALIEAHERAALALAEAVEALGVAQASTATDVYKLTRLVVACCGAVFVEAVAVLALVVAR